jgi:hypothetical protein
MIVRLLRLASFILCLIVIASFVAFAVNDTSAASKHQQEALATSSSPTVSSTKHEGSVRKALDETSNQITSPFAGVVSHSSSQWAIRGVKLLLALAVYGFGLGYLARALRVRV